MGQQFHARGKLLLSGEYLILDGAIGIGLPTKLGQSLSVESAPHLDNLHWQSYNVDKKLWYDLWFDPTSLTFLKGNDSEAGRRLERVLREASKLSDQDWKLNGIRVRTQLSFDRYWGLGTSSTLLSCVSQWAKVDPYKLAEKTFGGSGYDLACAKANGPIIYQRRKKTGHYITLPFSPAFMHHLSFIYLGKKQNSREGIKKYRSQVNTRPIREISQLSLEIASSTQDLDSFCGLLARHEDIIGRMLGVPRVQSLYFDDFPGVIKSLGAWGGDFVMAASPLPFGEVATYFKAKGFSVIFPFDKLIILDSN